MVSYDEDRDGKKDRQRQGIQHNKWSANDGEGGEKTETDKGTIQHIVSNDEENGQNRHADR